MIAKNASMIGSSIGTAVMIGTGPLGQTLGAAATIAIALGKRLFCDSHDLVSIKQKVPLLVLLDLFHFELLSPTEANKV
jgi:hypothetical protein